MGDYSDLDKLKSRIDALRPVEAEKLQSPVTPPTPLHGALSYDSEGKAEAAKNEADELAREFRTAEKWVIGTNIALAIIGIIALCIYNGQLKEMRKSTKAATIAANAAASAADTAKKTLDSSSESFMTEQRAYVYPTNEAMSTLSKTGKVFCEIPGLKDSQNRLCVDVHYTDGGKTPSVGDRTSRFAIVASDAEARKIITRMKVPKYIQNGSILAQGTDAWATAVTDPLTDKQIAGLATNTQALYIYGVIQYTDIFQRYHETGFCAKRLPSGIVFMYCPYGNWLDKRPVEEQEH